MHSISSSQTHNKVQIITPDSSLADLILQKLNRRAFISCPDRELVQLAGARAASLECTLKFQNHPNGRHMARSLLTLGLVPHSYLIDALSGFSFAGLYCDNTPIIRTSTEVEFEAIVIREDAIGYSCALLSQEGLRHVQRISAKNRHIAALQALKKLSMSVKLSQQSMNVSAYWLEDIKQHPPLGQSANTCAHHSAVAAA